MEIIEYKEELRDRVIDLLSAGSSERRNLKGMLWNWQFTEGPFVRGAKDVGVVFIESGNVVGFNGLMPVSLQYNGNVIEGAWSCDTIISPEHRGKGYGRVMAEAVMARFPIVIGLGISDIQANLMRKSGYEVCQDIDCFSYIQKTHSTKDVIKKGLQYIKIVKNTAKRPSTNGLQATVIDAEEIPRQVDSLWQEVASGFSKIVVRDYPYLKWKYGRHPFLKYQVIVIERNKILVGLGVFAKNYDVSRLLDYVGPSMGIQVKFLIVKTFKKICSNSRLLTCTCTDNEFKVALRYLGFRVDRNKPRFYVYSNMKNDSNAARNWFVMGGDSDHGIRP